MTGIEDRHDVTSEAGFAAFYDHAFTTVYRSAARLTRGDRPTAEDLVQSAFVRLVRAVHAGQVELVGVGWVVTAVRRLHIDGLRSADSEQRRIRLVANSTNHTVAPTTADGLLDGLSGREQTALILRYVEDLPVADVAALMNTSTSATESLLQRAKRKARDARGET